MAESDTRLANRVCHGDEEAVYALNELYFERLVKLGRKIYRDKLNDVPRSVEDEEDAAQSALRTFCRLALTGKLRDFANRHELWSLLVRLASRKIYKQRERATAMKRGAGKMPSLAEIHDAVSKAPGPQVEAAFNETLAGLTDCLGDSRLKRIAQLHYLEGKRPDEIAEDVGVSQRTVFRELKNISAKWETYLNNHEQFEE